jgi:hypothetical protein
VPRNALARLVFSSIEIEDDGVTAVMPQSDFAPFFVQRALDVENESVSRQDEYRLIADRR